MPIQLKPETERLVEQELAAGRFQSVDEIIQQGIRAREDESERWTKHREAIEWTLDFAKNRAQPLNGIEIKDLLEEGRQQ